MYGPPTNCHGSGANSTFHREQVNKLAEKIDLGKSTRLIKGRITYLRKLVSGFVMGTEIAPPQATICILYFIIETASFWCSYTRTYPYISAITERKVCINVIANQEIAPAKPLRSFNAMYSQGVVYSNHLIIITACFRLMSEVERCFARSSPLHRRRPLAKTPHAALFPG